MYVIRFEKRAHFVQNGDYKIFQSISTLKFKSLIKCLSPSTKQIQHLRL